MNPKEDPTVFLPHGGYRKLRSYKVAQAVYDATVVFCRRFCTQDRRMRDQMVQAARSGVRNISEGSGAAATSRKSEMKLKDGGFTERLHAARSQARNRGASDPSDRSDLSDPPGCPLCGRRMRRPTARRGQRQGQPFRGCPAYPDCTGTRPVDPLDRRTASD